MSGLYARGSQVPVQDFVSVGSVSRSYTQIRKDHRVLIVQLGTTWISFATSHARREFSRFSRGIDQVTIGKVKVFVVGPMLPTTGEPGEELGQLIRNISQVEEEMRGKTTSQVALLVGGDAVAYGSGGYRRLLNAIRDSVVDFRIYHCR